MTIGIEFAVSADMSGALRSEVEALPEEAWADYTTLRAYDRAPTEERQWPEVEFVPTGLRRGLVAETFALDAPAPRRRLKNAPGTVARAQGIV